MKLVRFLIFIISFCFSFTAVATSFHELKEEAYREFDEENYPGSLHLFQEVFSIRKGEVKDYYIALVCAVKLNDQESINAYVDSASGGVEWYEMMLDDENLSGIKEIVQVRYDALSHFYESYGSCRFHGWGETDSLISLLDLEYRELPAKKVIGTYLNSLYLHFKEKKDFKTAFYYLSESVKFNDMDPNFTSGNLHFSLLDYREAYKLSPDDFELFLPDVARVIQLKDMLNRGRNYMYDMHKDVLGKNPTFSAELTVQDLEKYPGLKSTAESLRSVSNELLKISPRHLLTFSESSWMVWLYTLLGDEQENLSQSMFNCFNLCDKKQLKTLIRNSNSSPLFDTRVGQYFLKYFISKKLYPSFSDKHVLFEYTSGTLSKSERLMYEFKKAQGFNVSGLKELYVFKNGVDTVSVQSEMINRQLFYQWDIEYKNEDLNQISLKLNSTEESILMYVPFKGNKKVSSSSYEATVLSKRSKPFVSDVINKRFKFNVISVVREKYFKSLLKSEFVGLVKIGRLNKFFQPNFLAHHKFSDIHNFTVELFKNGTLLSYRDRLPFFDGFISNQVNYQLYLDSIEVNFRANYRGLVVNERKAYVRKWISLLSHLNHGEMGSYVDYSSDLHRGNSLAENETGRFVDIIVKSVVDVQKEDWDSYKDKNPYEVRFSLNNVKPLILKKNSRKKGGVPFLTTSFLYEKDNEQAIFFGESIYVRNRGFVIDEAGNSATNENQLYHLNKEYYQVYDLKRNGYELVNLGKIKKKELSSIKNLDNKRTLYGFKTANGGVCFVQEKGDSIVTLNLETNTETVLSQSIAHECSNESYLVLNNICSVTIADDTYLLLKTVRYNEIDCKSSDYKTQLFKLNEKGEVLNSVVLDHNISKEVFNLFNDNGKVGVIRSDYRDRGDVSFVSYDNELSVIQEKLSLMMGVRTVVPTESVHNVVSDKEGNVYMIFCKESNGEFYLVMKKVKIDGSVSKEIILCEIEEGFTDGELILSGEFNLKYCFVTNYGNKFWSVDIDKKQLDKF